MFLSASNAGKALYRKFGFRDLEEKTVDFVHLGAGGLRTTTAMFRDVASGRN